MPGSREIPSPLVRMHPSEARSGRAPYLRTVFFYSSFLSFLSFFFFLLFYFFPGESLRE